MLAETQSSEQPLDGSPLAKKQRTWTITSSYNNVAIAPIRVYKQIRCNTV